MAIQELKRHWLEQEHTEEDKDNDAIRRWGLNHVHLEQVDTGVFKFNNKGYVKLAMKDVELSPLGLKSQCQTILRIRLIEDSR